MRQVLLCVSILLLGLTWSFAQTSGSSETSPSGSSSGASQSAGAQSGSSGQMGQTGQTGAGGHMTVEGCLSGSNGNYTLTDKNGNSYQLTGDTAKLSEHVGHEVKVMGSSSAAGASSSGSTTGASGSQQSLQVTSVKHVSKSCQAGAGTMSH